MSDEPEIEVEFEPEEGESYPDTLNCPDGEIHFGGDAQQFLTHWLAKLGFEPVGGAVVFGEGCSIGIIHPETGEMLTPQTVAKLVKSATGPRRIQ